MAELVYNLARRRIADGLVQLGTEANGAAGTTVLGCMLVSTDYLDLGDGTIIDLDFVADGTTQSTTPYEAATSSNYARQTVGARTITEDDVGNRGDIDVADITFSAVSSGAGVIGAAIIFSVASSGTLNTESTAMILISKYDTGFPVTPNGGDITVQWSTGGILQFTT